MELNYSTRAINTITTLLNIKPQAFLPLCAQFLPKYIKNPLIHIPSRPFGILSTKNNTGRCRHTSRPRSTDSIVVKTIGAGNKPIGAHSIT
jgi:hypothetical protein